MTGPTIPTWSPLTHRPGRARRAWRPLMLASVLGTALAFASCSDAPTSPPRPDDAAPIVNKSRPGVPLSSPASGVLEDGTVFRGTVTITRLDLGIDRQLLASGTIVGTRYAADGTTIIGPVNETFSREPVTLTHSSAAALAGDVTIQQAGTTCEILELDLGPIHLDLLGLVLDVSPISIDLTAVRGPGNLLGNLLCALVGLLDGPGLLGQILAILEQINALLGNL